MSEIHLGKIELYLKSLAETQEKLLLIAQEERAHRMAKEADQAYSRVWDYSTTLDGGE